VGSKRNSVATGWRWFIGGFEGEEAKPGFTQSVSVFTVKVVGVFCYFSGFPDGTRTKGPNLQLPTLLIPENRNHTNLLLSALVNGKYSMLYIYIYIYIYISCMQLCIMFFTKLIRSRDSAVGIVSGYGLQDREAEVLVPVGSRIFSTSSRPAVEPTQPPIQWVPEVTRPGREADNSPPTSAEFKKNVDLCLHAFIA
jgi:hypothetical protein